MKRITVSASKEYEVVISDDFSALKAEIAKVYGGEKIAVITDSNTSPLFYKKIAETLIGYKLFEITVPAGEKSKNAENYIKILSRLADLRFTRKDCILSLGGGVIGDLGGFVASTYMRGIKYVQCPTTLLSFVDSSVGGKTAIDLPEGKNLVGTFYQPSLVYISLSALKTLPKKEIDCGMGEIVKYAFLSKTVTADDILGGIDEDLIEKCIMIKADVVKQDEFDCGLRATLNLGHTIGHAIENLSGYTISHGLCVAKGISAIIDLSADFYHLSDEKVNKMRALLSSWKFDLSIPFTKGEVCEQLFMDKKAESGGVNFILIKDVGEVKIERLSEEYIRKTFYGKDAFSV